MISWVYAAISANRPGFARPFDRDRQVSAHVVKVELPGRERDEEHR